MEFGVLLMLVGVAKFIPIFTFSFVCLFVRTFCIEVREPYLCDFLKKQNKKNVGSHSGIYKPIYFKPGLSIETTEVCILISVWVTLVLIQGQGFMRNQKLLRSFSVKLAVDLDEIQCVATTCWFAKARAKLFCANRIQRRELC